MSICLGKFTFAMDFFFSREKDIKTILWIRKTSNIKWKCILTCVYLTLKLVTYCESETDLFSSQAPWGLAIEGTVVRVSRRSHHETTSMSNTTYLHSDKARQTSRWTYCPNVQLCPYEPYWFHVIKFLGLSKAWDDMTGNRSGEQTYQRSVGG